MTKPQGISDVGSSDPHYADGKTKVPETEEGGFLGLGHGPSF